MTNPEADSEPSELTRAVMGAALRHGIDLDVDEIVLGIIEAAIIIRGMDLKGDRGKALARVRDLLAGIE